MARAEAGLSALRRTALEDFPNEVASILDRGAADDVARILADLAPTRAAQVLRQLQPDVGLQVLCSFDAAFAKSVLEELEPVGAVILLARAEEDSRNRLLELLEVGYARELRGLLSYSRDTAGGMMNPRPTVFHPNTTVQDAVAQLRRQKHRRIQDVYLVDEGGRLVGSVPMTEVVLADDLDELGAIATRPAPSVPDTATREGVLEQLEKNRNGSLPVVDFDGRLLGVLRQEELLRAARRDAAGNALLMVGVSKDERALSPFYLAVRNRLPWLLINLLTAFLAAAVVGLFEATIATYTALAVLLPVVAGQSGNTGAQALAVTMRGLALREVRVHHWLRIAVKEVAAGASNGFAVAVTTGIAVFFWSQSFGLALVIGMSMVISMSAAGLAGAIIPMMLTALRQDPAQSSSIVLTTVTDVVGFFSFLGIATVLSFML